MKCQETQVRLVAFIEGTLEHAEQQAVIDHLKECPSCRRSEAELRKLLQSIDQYQEKTPDEVLDQLFTEMLEEEKATLQDSETFSIKKREDFWIALAKVAAVILLIVGSYFIGEYQANQQHLAEKNRLKTEMALSLMESSSASKRIQAVVYTKELEVHDTKILLALIERMNSDKHLNVRLAALSALSQFTESEVVLEALIDRLEAEKNAAMQLELIQILTGLLDNRIRSVIEKIQKDRDTPGFLKEEIEQQINSQINIQKI